MKELQVHFMTFCDYAMVSQENKLSIIGIFDELRVKQLPGGLPSAAIVALVKGEPDKSYTLTIKGDKGNKNVFPPLQVNFRTGISGSTNMTININNMNFTEEGEYRFALIYEKKEIGYTSIKVIHVKQPNEVTYTLPN